MKTYRFYKDQDGWFIDIPGYPFEKETLAMVAGADTFLDVLAEGNNEVTLNLSTDYIEGYEQLIRTEILRLGLGGANYILNSYIGTPLEHKVWLCPVTLYVFQKYPSIIYFSKVC